MAAIKSMEFSDGGELEFVTARMTAEEAAFIAFFTGQDSDPEAVMRGGAPASSHLYAAFAGDLFNRLYPNGVEEWHETF